MNIHAGIKDYEVIAEQDLSFLLKLVQMPNAEFVVDQKVFQLYGQYFRDVPEERLFLLEASEENKVIETALAICEKMTEIPAKRNSHLISVGGGIIQDLTGFAANILYRGIRWTYVPTTLLASCDSCIGGKTSLNYRKYKNLLGTFFPPDEVHICPAFFHTLSKQDFESGLGEVVKFNIMAGTQGLKIIESGIDQLLDREEAALQEFIESSLLFKKQIIEADEFDKGERIKLNFAHTFGHAVETVTGYEIPHGTAVAAGMIMADYLSAKRGLLRWETCQRAEKILLKVIHIHVRLTDYAPDLFVEAIRKDKKQVDKCLTAVLMTDTAMELPVVHDIQKEEIEDAVCYFQRLYDTYSGEKA